MPIIGVIDRYPIERVGIKRVLNDNLIDVAIQAVVDVIELTETGVFQTPELLIVGVPNEGMATGLDQIDKCKVFFPSVPPVVYGGIPQMGIVKECLKRGTKGFALKENNEDELILCLKAVLRGGQYLSSCIGVPSY